MRWCPQWRIILSDWRLLSWRHVISLFLEDMPLASMMEGIQSPPVLQFISSLCLRCIAAFSCRCTVVAASVYISRFGELAANEFPAWPTCGCGWYKWLELNHWEPNVVITRSSATAEKQRVSCPHGWRGTVWPSSPLPLHSSGYTCAYGRIRKPQRTYVKRAVRKAHFKMNRAFKVIVISAGRNPERCIVVMCN